MREISGTFIRRASPGVPLEERGDRLLLVFGSANPVGGGLRLRQSELFTGVQYVLHDGEALAHSERGVLASLRGQLECSCQSLTVTGEGVYGLFAVRGE
ncbi:hypothetical protein [Brevibacterium sp. Mu109]|uniref:hypothetical protein n=1 Tax=Brevibacterium sp. Mu109 TaxID=1255669 RepID=UPI0011AED9CC|nr:hypothetical protein [Brevibacterium sp. Mu109]